MTLTHAPVLYRDETIAADSTIVIHRPRRRRWWPVAVAVAAAVVLVAVGLGQLTAPALSFDGAPTVWRTAPGDETSVHPVHHLLGTEVSVGYQPAGTVSAQ